MALKTISTNKNWKYIWKMGFIWSFCFAIIIILIQAIFNELDFEQPVFLYAFFDIASRTLVCLPFGLLIGFLALKSRKSV